MILPIVAYGSPMLRVPCQPANLSDPQLPILVGNLLHTMKNAHGAGLAAPQVNVPQCVFVTEAAGVFINPQILWYSPEQLWDEEGCLSIPGIQENVPRAKRIAVSWVNEKLEPQTGEFEDDAARVIQHEYDHLQGKLYLDYLPPFRKRLLQGRLNRVLKGKAECAYPLRLRS